jgi:hypothetical protein
MRPALRFMRPLAVVALLAAAMPASAARFELQLGRSYMDSYGAGTAFLEGVFAEHPLGDTGLTWSPDASLGWIDGRDAGLRQRYRYSGYNYSAHPQSWIGAGGVRLRFADDNAWYRPLFFSFQPAVHGGRTLALSSSYEFVSTLGWQAKHWSVQVRHISNGELHEPNRGETMLLLGIALH